MKGDKKSDGWQNLVVPALVIPPGPKMAAAETFCAMLELVDTLERHAMDGGISLIIDLSGGGKISIDADSAIRTRNK